MSPTSNNDGRRQNLENASHRAISHQDLEYMLLLQATTPNGQSDNGNKKNGKEPQRSSSSRFPKHRGDMNREYISHFRNDTYTNTQNNGPTRFHSKRDSSSANIKMDKSKVSTIASIEDTTNQRRMEVITPSTFLKTQEHHISTQNKKSQIVSSSHYGRMADSKVSSSNHVKSKDSSKRSNFMYEEYVSEATVMKGLKLQKFFKGTLRVNAQSFNKAYVTVLDGSFPCDIYVEGLPNRNRAMHGDEVIIDIFNEETWKDLATCSLDNEFDEAELEDLKAHLNLDYILDCDESEISAIKKEAAAIEESNRENEILEAEYKLWMPLPQLLKKIKCPIKSNEKALCEIGVMAKNLSKQPCGRVIFISERKSRGLIVGFIEPISPPLKSSDGHMMLSSSERNLMFKPYDKRLPNVLVRKEILPKNLLFNIDQLKTLIFSVELEPIWPVKSKLIFAKKLYLVGKVGSIEAETRALMIQNKIFTDHFPPDIISSLKPLLPFSIYDNHIDWAIPAEEIGRRRDYRKHRVLSIDPSSAKDLDDALHIIKLNEDTYEVGVHIADVSYFVAPGTALDSFALKRGTSTYFPHRVIPMLPPILCEDLCSLNPGKDRLAFSVVWKMNADGTLIEELAEVKFILIRKPGTAQKIIDGTIFIPDLKMGQISDEQWDIKNRPLDGHTEFEVASDVLSLHTIARCRRMLRFSEVGGRALEISSTRMSYSMKRESTGEPMPLDSIDESDIRVDMDEYVITDSNKMVEEFMLLTNYLVARRLLQSILEFMEEKVNEEDGSFDIRNEASAKKNSDNYLEELFKKLSTDDSVERCVLLRNHEPPSKLALNKVVKAIHKRGMDFVATSSATIHRSLRKISESQKAGSLIPQAIHNLLIGPMKSAKYIVSDPDNHEFWSHFALNIRCYTHFTSPIRRYADVVVHRMISEVLEGKSSAYTKERLEEIVNQCNDRRELAKAAQERSETVFLCLHLKSVKKPYIVVKAIVMSLGKSGFTVFIPKLNFTSKLHLDRIAEAGGYEYNSSLDAANNVLLFEKTTEGHRPRIPGNANEDEMKAFQSQKWKSVEISFFTEVWVLCSTKDTQHLEVRVDFLGLA